MNWTLNRPWRRLGTVLALTALWAVSGCDTDTSPRVTDLTASPACGVIAPHDVLDGAGNVIRTEFYLEVEFFGLGSGGNHLSDPNNFNVPLNASWDFGDGGTAGSETLVFHRYTVPGEYTVTLRVEDDDGDTDERSIVVNVLAPEEFIQVDINLDAGPDPVMEAPAEGEPEVLIGYNVTVSGTLLTGCPNTGGLAAQYFWVFDFADGSQVRDVSTVSHFYDVPDSQTTYPIVLSISEFNTAITQSDQVEVTLEPAP